MSSTLRSSRLIDLCTPSISYDRQVQSGCVAFDNQMYEIIDDTGQVVMIPNIMGLTDSTLVDILAWQFHVDFYDKTRDLEFRKQLVQLSIQWHMTKGTVQLVQDVLDLYFPGVASLQEWYEYKSPLPPNYPDEGGGVATLAFVPADVDPLQDLFKLANTFANGDVVIFDKGVPGNSLPAPIVEEERYYVINASPTEFQISATVGGAALDITSSGTGTNNNILHPYAGGDHLVATFAPPQVDVAGNRFLITGHGLTVNQQITFVIGSFSVGGRLPTPLVPNIYYYVANPHTNDFQVSPSPWQPAGDTVSGSVVDLLDAGIGSNNEIHRRGGASWHDRYRFRVLIDTQQIDPATEAIVLALIDNYKPISRWMEGFVRAITSECDIGWTGMLLRFIYRESEAPDYP